MVSNAVKQYRKKKFAQKDFESRVCIENVYQKRHIEPYMTYLNKCPAIIKQLVQINLLKRNK